MLREKLKRAHTWRRIFYERLTEPIHLNAISLFVAAFESYRTKIAFDLPVTAFEFVSANQAYTGLRRCAGAGNPHQRILRLAQTLAVHACSG